MIAFIHIPKTGGISFYNLMIKEYKNQVRWFANQGKAIDCLTNDKLEPPLKAIAGHFGFLIHDALIQHGYQPKCISLLRNPLDRIVSLYKFILGIRGHGIFKKILRQHPDLSHMAATHLGYQKEIMANALYSKVNLEEFTISGLTIETDNFQTRTISGISPPFGECHPEMLTIALENIEKYFTAIGTLENLEPFIAQIKTKLGWGNAQNETMIPDNVTPIITIPELQKPICGKIAKIVNDFNYLDVQLFEYVNNLYSDSFANIG